MFSTQARWDRRLPQDADSLNEKIWVTALFRAGKITPRYFIWNNRAYRVKKITYSWQERMGEDLLNCFSVDTPRGLYQISFSQKSLSWKLNKAIT
jgi:hypothetical protein